MESADWLVSMNRLCHTLLILLCAFGAFLILSDRSATAFQTQIESQRRGLSAEEKRGKAFYLRGESSSGQEITALMGEIEVPVTTLSCAGCHGARGEGKTEGGRNGRQFDMVPLNKALRSHSRKRAKAFRFFRDFIRSNGDSRR